MTHSNLPPGVNESDIPGNRPQDIKYEKLVGDLLDAAEQAILLGMTKEEYIEEASDSFDAWKR